LSSTHMTCNGKRNRQEQDAEQILRTAIIWLEQCSNDDPNTSDLKETETKRCLDNLAVVVHELCEEDLNQLHTKGSLLYLAVLHHNKALVTDLLKRVPELVLYRNGDDPLLALLRKLECELETARRQMDEQGCDFHFESPILPLFDKAEVKLHLYAKTFTDSFLALKEMLTIPKALLELVLSYAMPHIIKFRNKSFDARHAQILDALKKMAPLLFAANLDVVQTN
jgi:hypothetical protein